MSVCELQMLVVGTANAGCEYYKCPGRVGRVLVINKNNRARYVKLANMQAWQLSSRLSYSHCVLNENLAWHRQE